MLEINGLVIHYGSVEVVHGVTLHVAEKTIVALIGPNGAGKSSVLKSISGLVRPSGGEILFLGARLIGVPPHEIAAAGIAHVLEGRHLFGSLTVEDNLLLAGYSKGTASAGSMEALLQRWPILAQRRHFLASSLSGGEQQLLAIARALMSRPRLLMLDEPSWGLAPMLVRELMKTFAQLRSEGTTILLVEQMAKMALQVCDYGYVMSSGKIELEGSASDLLANPALQASYLGGEVNLEKPQGGPGKPFPEPLEKGKSRPAVTAAISERPQRETERQRREGISPASVFSSGGSFRAPVGIPHHPLQENFKERERQRELRQQSFQADKKSGERRLELGQPRASGTAATPSEVRPSAPSSGASMDWRTLETQRQERQATWQGGARSDRKSEGESPRIGVDWRAQEQARSERQMTFFRETRVPQASEAVTWEERERERKRHQEEWQRKTRSGQSQSLLSLPAGRVTKNFEELERLRLGKEKAWQNRTVSAASPQISGKFPKDRKNLEVERQQRQVAWEKKK